MNCQYLNNMCKMIDSACDVNTEVYCLGDRLLRMIAGITNALMLYQAQSISLYPSISGCRGTLSFESEVRRNVKMKAISLAPVAPNIVILYFISARSLWSSEIGRLSMS